MPATYTHHVFTKDVYKVIEKEIQEKIDVPIFNLFGKSFDILFFSKPKLGIYAHNHDVNAYFANIIKYIKKYEYYRDPQVLAYLYGSICHYVLDSTCHPYIYYKSGKYQMNKKATKKYKGLHDWFEYMIDAIFYQERNHKMIYKSHLKKEIFPKIQFHKDLDKIINSVYLDTFGEQNASKTMKKGIKNYQFVFNHIMMSRFGIKYHIYRLLDKVHITKKCTLANYCYYIKTLDTSVLNKERNKWYYPVDKKVNYHYSFYDLYDVSIEKARVLINRIHHALDKDDKEIKKVLREIGNLSYSTGKNANKDYVMKYFEF